MPFSISIRIYIYIIEKRIIRVIFIYIMICNALGLIIIKIYSAVVMALKSIFMFYFQEVLM